jgi:hypothetical protein
MHIAILFSLILTGILGVPLAYTRSMFEWEIGKGVAVPLVPLRFYVTAALPCIAVLLLIAYEVLGGLYEHSALLQTVFGWLAIVMPLLLLALFLWRPRTQRYRLRGR